MELEGFHTAADGALRCNVCALTPDLCTCQHDHPLWQILEACFGHYALDNMEEK